MFRTYRHFYFERELKRRANLPPLIRSVANLQKGTKFKMDGKYYKVT